MYYNVLKIKDVIDLEDGKFSKKALAESEDGGVFAVALKKDEIIDTHTSKKDAMVCVIEGEIEMHFTAEKFTLEKGEMIIFKKDKEHKVLAKKDSKFLIVKF